MPYETVVLPERQLGVACLCDEVTGDAIVEALHALYADEDWKPGYNAIWDYRRVTSLAVSPIETADILDLLRHLEPRIGEGRTAAVVRDETDYAIARLIILRSDTERREREVFYSFDKAIGWVEGGAGERIREASHREALRDKVLRMASRVSGR